MFAVLLLVGGSISFLNLGQLEFPEFTIKQALVITSYPGASPEQVEEEVTLPLEDALQQLDAVDTLTSINSAGLSQIEIEVKDNYDATELPQVWDEVRRKVSDTTGQLPAGVSTPVVYDDFGDVFGIFLTLSGEGYSYRELENYADFLRRELVLVDGVKKVSVAGAISEQVVVEISQQKLNALGLDPNYIYSLLTSQNGVSNAGNVLVGNSRIRLHTTGEFTDVGQMAQLVISPPGSTKLTYLGDIANIYRDVDETPSTLYHASGDRSLSIGISFSSGVNVVDVGERIGRKMDELRGELPIGMSLSTVYNQSEMVDESVQGFLINLLESVAIVIGVLLVFMGLRSGLLMGAVLLLTILGTFIVMQIMGIELQIISLGALIIALGMLVDNAIVVTEGVLVGIRRGQSKLETARQVISQSQWPLLGATVIAIIAFAPIGLSDNQAGEFSVSLFQVLFISLFLSWVTAMTLTPFFCSLIFKEGEPVAEEMDEHELYKGWLFTAYRQFLRVAIRFRAVTVILVTMALLASVAGFGYIKNAFFPASNTPMFFIDVWMPEGTDILATERLISRIETDMLEQQDGADTGMVNLTSVVGGGSQRFFLSYIPEKGYSSYGQLIVEMTDRETMDRYMGQLERDFASRYPEAEFRFKRMENGPSSAAKIEARFYGDDPEILRQLAVKAEAVLEAEPTATGVRHNWRNQVPVIRPQLVQARARETGITKADLDNALQVNFTGKTIGTYREGSHLLPILVRAPADERLDADSLWKLQVYSSENSDFVPVSQIVSDFASEWEDPLIMRRDRKRVLTVLANPANGSNETADSVFRKIRGGIEAIPLPDGYELEWGGEYENSTEAKVAVFGSLPLGYLVMFLITVLLFNSVRQPLVIWFTVPLALIGVVSGLLIFDAPFSFMALLGLLSLSGMIIKNGIVLVDQINLEMDQGSDPYLAVVNSAVSRVRPVCMAALTTMLGMVPLIPDAFFGSMAITIIFGLGMGSVLTLIILPVAYTMIFRIPVPGK